MYSSILLVPLGSPASARSRTSISIEFGCKTVEKSMLEGVVSRTKVGVSMRGMDNFILYPIVVIISTF